MVNLEDNQTETARNRTRDENNLENDLSIEEDETKQQNQKLDLGGIIKKFHQTGTNSLITAGLTYLMINPFKETANLFPYLAYGSSIMIGLTADDDKKSKLGGASIALLGMTDKSWQCAQGLYNTAMTSKTMAEWVNNDLTAAGGRAMKMLGVIALAYLIKKGWEKIEPYVKEEIFPAIRDYIKD